MRACLLAVPPCATLAIAGSTRAARFKLDAGKARVCDASRSPARQPESGFSRAASSSPSKRVLFVEAENFDKVNVLRNCLASELPGLAGCETSVFFAVLRRTERRID